MMCMPPMTPWLACPNNQNPDRGIETMLMVIGGEAGTLVRTTRIPTEGLKPPRPRCMLCHLVSPNNQNPDRGIETLSHPSPRWCPGGSEQPESRPRD